MSTARDDVVIRPRLEPSGAATPVRERTDVVVRKVRERRQGLLRSLVKRALRMRMLRAAARTAGVPVPGIGAGLRKLGPWAIPVVFGLGIARVISGRSFEGMQEDAKQWLLGDMDDRAVGAKAAREFLTQDPSIGGNMTPGHARRVFTDMNRHFTAMETSRQGFMQDRAYQVDGAFDIAALRAAEAAKAAGQAIAQKMRELVGG